MRAIAKTCCRIFLGLAIVLLAQQEISLAGQVYRPTDAAGAINASNVTYSGNSYSGDGTAGNKGAGSAILVESDGTFSMKSLAISGLTASGNTNTITFNNDASNSNAYASVFIVGDIDNSTQTELTGQQTLTGFSLSNNQTIFNITDDNGNSSAFGGGAVIRDLPNLSFSGGAISTNKLSMVISDTTANDDSPRTAAGGGLVIESQWTANTAISSTEFTGNNVAITSSGTGVVSASNNAIGGALFLQSTNDEQRDGTWDDSDNTGMAVTISGNTTFTGNYATVTGAGIAGGGAIAAEIAVNVDTQDTKFSSNYASAEAGAAQGGAVRYVLRDALTTDGTTSYEGSLSPYPGTTAYSRFTRVEFSKNYAKSTTGLAQGGAIYTNKGTAINSSSFTENYAYASAIDGTARGGAIYSEAGDVTVTNSSFIKNDASGTTAQGGAIYMNTTNGATLTLTALANETVEFSGNTLNKTTPNSIHFGEAGGTSIADAYLTLTTGTNLTGDNGQINLLDPIRVDMASNSFYLTKTGSGDLNWDGSNDLFTDTGNSNITITNGRLSTGKDFTVSAAGSSALNVSLNNLDALSFNISRDIDTALFNFAGADAHSLGVTNGTKLYASSSYGGAREVYSFAAREYLLFEGLTQGEASATVGNLSGSALDPYTYITGVTSRQDDVETYYNVYTDAGYRSPFDHAGANTSHARGALYSLVNRTDANGDYYVSDHEWAAMQRSAAFVNPEIYMQAANVMLDGVWRLSNTAVDYGVRNPHRLRLRAEDAYTTRRTYRGRYQAPQPQPMYQAAPQIQNYQAYPRLMDCYYPGYGFRIWAGYVGEWRNQRERSNYKGYRVDRDGVVLGINYDFGTVASVGVYGGYSDTRTKAKDYNGRVDGDNGHLGVIGRVSPFATLPGLSFYGDFGYHFADNDGKRDAGGYSASGSFDQHAFTVGLGAEYVLALGWANITPQLDLRYTHLNQDGYHESGNSSTTTDVRGFTSNQFTHRLGVELSHDFLFGGGCVVSPAVSVGWRHQWGNRKHSSTARYIKDSNPLPFRVAATPDSRDSLDIGVALKTLWSISSSTKLGVNVGYNLNLAGKAYTNTVYVGAELGF